MKRTLVRLGLPLVTALSCVTVLVSPARADTLFQWGNVCWNGHCVNNWDGALGGGNVLKFYAYSTAGEPNNDWNIWKVGVNGGVVNCNAGIPFGNTNQAIVNMCNQDNYNGDAILKLAFAPNGAGKGMCIDQGEYNGRQDDALAVIEKCGPSNQLYYTQNFVLSSADYLVAVWATQVSFANQLNIRYFLGACDPNGSVSNGSDVCITWDHELQWSFVTPP